jgi:EAL domain-containing protein (putative c-di-GMP-specific phosphodiesterase class I)
VATGTPPPLPAGDDLVLHVLALARRCLGVDVAWLSRLSPGRSEQIITHVDAAAPGLGPRPGDVRDPLLGLGAYVGVPVRDHDESVVGMLCCASGSTHPDLAGTDLTVLELLAGVVAEVTAGTTWASAVEGLRHRTTRAIVGRGRSVALQPIVDVQGGIATGVEALTRFDSPQGPEVWFAEAEPLGLRLPLELAAARTALAVLRRPGHVGYLSLNLSPEAICGEAFHTLVEAVDPRDLVIEITEHAAVNDYEKLCHALRRHRAAGLRIAVDDVGAGYASMRHILELSPDFIKMDLSLVREIHLDHLRQALVTALVGFAATMGAVLVAEGVETQGELDMLVGLGVRHVQGYFLCPPCPDPPATGFPRPSRLVRPDRGAIPA